MGRIWSRPDCGTWRSTGWGSTEDKRNISNGWSRTRIEPPGELDEKKIEEIQTKEGMKTLLQKLVGQSGRVNEELLLAIIPVREIEDNMKKGKIPIGFSDSLVWHEIAEKMKKLPEKQKEKEKQLATLKKEEQNILEKLQQLEEEKAKLDDVLKNTQHEKKILKNEIQSWLQFKKTHFQQTSRFVQTIAEKEKKLAQQMDTCRLSEDEFTSHCTGDAPLSLVFNAIGLSEQSIKQLEYLDEFEFLNTIIQMEDNACTIPIGEQFELAYCQKLWNEQGVFPSNDHKENCIVCDHSVPEDLCHLIEEHEKPFDMDWIKKEKITGRRLIGMPLSNIRNIFPNNKEIKSTWIYFQKIHKQAST